MFLVNNPPLVTFQTKWGPFGQPATCSLPASFSESEEDISRTSISKQVHNIINSIQSEESSLELTGEYECIMQKDRKGEYNIERELKTGSTLIKGHTRESATLVVPAEFQDNKDDSSEFGPLTLDSDSDDSVDRDIEEAIQEFLKEKGAPVATNPDNAKSSCSVGPRDLIKDIQRIPSANSYPVKMVTAGDVCCSFELTDRPRSASPDSVSSDDSFEQSIKAEIEQFLNEKKQQNQNGGACDPTNAPCIETPVKPKLNPSKVQQKPSLKHRDLEILQKHPPDSLSPHSKGLNFGTELTKNESSQPDPKVNVKQNPKQTRPCQPLHSTVLEELSDSSSDDGIEEAIQLYQLEKSKQGGGLKTASNIPPEKVDSSAKPDSSNVSRCLERTAATNFPIKTDNRKRKRLNNKPSAFQDISNCQTLATKRPLLAEDVNYSKCETEMQAALRAETVAELMCAEAILDISKTILPTQPQSTYTVPAENKSAYPDCESDSSVDSDDSIEQEIRSFLARKAQGENVSTATVKQEQSSTEKKSEMSPISKAHKKEKSVVTNFLCKNVALGNVDLNLEKSKSQQLCSVLPLPSEVATKAEQNCLTAGAKKYTPLMLNRGRGKGRGPTKGYGSRNNSSSSLDSDEDLDSAIKDLLKSKKKSKKRPKDGKFQCRKKIRFGEAITKPIETCEGSKQEECPQKGSPVLKGILLNPTNPNERCLEKSKKEKVITMEKTDLTIPSSSNNDREPKHGVGSDKVIIETHASSDAQDSSSVDSDDSIEQEIRKFLAEKARESAALTEAQKEIPSASCPNINILENVQPLKQENNAGLSPVTSTAATTAQVTVVHQLPMYGCKPNISQVRQIHSLPVEVSTGTKPVSAQNCLIIKRECFVDQNRIIKPTEQRVQTHGFAQRRVVMKTDSSSPPGKSPFSVSGNFVAGLKYVSGTDKQLVLNVGNTGPSRLATEICKTAISNGRLARCKPVEKKGPVLEKSKDVQTINIPKTPLVRPGLYLLTTKVCKENSPSLCLPINTATCESGINLMSIKYCCNQVNTPNSCVGTVSVDQHKSGEGRACMPSNAAESVLINTKTSEAKTAGEGLERECSPCSLNVSAGEELVANSVKNMKENKSSQEREKV
ncbi:hypothetical protein GDO86_014870 [Hymenochirus boettgeri]|uniref:Protein phosphatase 1 regulatory subunit 26 N-terminal domain-containing protein n=1 Tax=Hymenochirus boettgeri TaxID=247094 RepID=A0A8T2JYQ0_9PIPI|nr:hypothetical protein GDO86_014870 [Hymenochirus boettgeri]